MSFANDYLSFSRLKRYAQCPKSYQLHYIQKAPSTPNASLLFGSLLHAALERVYREIVAEKLSGRFPEDRLLAAYKDEWSRSGLSEFAVFQEGLTILGNFARQHALVDHTSILSVEQEFRLSVERFQVLGYIDRVDKVDDETVAIVDYKSNRAIFTREEIDYDLQLSIYAMAARMLWPWAKNVRLGLYLLRHGILMETTRTEEDLAAAREYIAMLGQETESATEFPARLNENCVWCDHSAQCPTYHRALLGKVESVCQDEKDIEAVAREREEVARMAKILYARKDALEKILKAQLQEVDRLELGGMVYTIGKTTQVSYATEPTLTVFRELTGKNEDELVPLLLSVEKAKVDALVKDLTKSLAPADARMLKARIEAIAEKSVSPRFNAQRATTAPAGDAP
ncbi:MAG: PD-(D/E)XK nuclease family protein [Myxococcales bacterium]|nr:PD-(D/E)XK nuclease family protein [Myxococcales bacterium]